MPTRDWSHQQAAVRLTREAISNGFKAVIVTMATGAGKSRVAAEIVHGASGKDKKSLFIVHRRNLVTQFLGTLKDKYGVESGFVMSGHDYVPGFKSYCGTVQTVSKRIEASLLNESSSLFSLNDALSPDIILIDECQYGLSEMFTDVYAAFPDALLIGFTATPCRADDRAMGAVFDCLIDVPGADTKSLTEKGILAKVRYFSCDTKGIENIKHVRAGKYINKEQDEVFNNPRIVADVVLAWLKNAENRPTILFAVNVKHSRSLEREFKSNGIECTHLEARSTDDERDEAFDALNRGEIKIILNCQLYREGMDVPDVSCVVLACKLASLGSYRQMVGRGLRLSAGAEYDDCILLDHGGNLDRHGPVDDEVEWTLKGKEKAWKKKEQEKKEKKPVKCKSCEEVFEGLSVCPRCGTELVDFGKAIETAEGELVEVDPKKRNKDLDWVTKRLVMGAIMWKCKEKGYQDGWGKHMYRTIFGVWPNDPRVSSAVAEKPEKGSKAARLITYGMIKKAAEWKKKKNK